jgi:hypothetical protein
MKQHILEQFIDRVIDILVESRLDERIQANKDFKNAILKKRNKDAYRKQGTKSPLDGFKTPKFDGDTRSARNHTKHIHTDRPGAMGHKMLDKAGEARRRGDKEESRVLRRASGYDRTHGLHKDQDSMPDKKPLP